MYEKVLNTNGLLPVSVNKSYYMTFDGKCCYCKISVLSYSEDRLYMEVLYEDGIKEKYLLVSDDGYNYSGMKRESVDDGRVQFKLLTHCEWVLLTGFWKCGGREGEWYISGRKT